jgi:hypothetical protein
MLRQVTAEYLQFGDPNREKRRLINDINKGIVAGDKPSPLNPASSVCSYPYAMWTKFDDLRFCVKMGLRKGLARIRGMRRPLTDDEQDTACWCRRDISLIA